MSVKPDTKGQLNRQKIVDEANALFYRRGFNKTSFSEVALASGIPKGNFYFYFKSKDELLHAVIEERYAFIQQRLKDYEQECRSPLECLKRLAEMPLTEVENIIHYGCPIGSLATELAKTKITEKAQLEKLFDLYVNWGEKQFQELGQGGQSRQLARRLMARLQGIITLANVYADAEFLEQEIIQVKGWLESFARS